MRMNIGEDSAFCNMDEVRTLSRLREANPLGEQPVQHLIDHFIYKEHLMLVTPCYGQSLLAWCRTFPSNEQRLAFFLPCGLAALANQMAHALSFIHQLGITHCDVKPANICIKVDLISNIHLFTLIDMGSAVYTHSDHHSYTQSRWYRAPEVMLGAPWGHAVDVWSLGCTLAEMLLGMPLFKGDSVESVLATMISVRGPLPPSLLARATEVVRMGSTPERELYEANTHGGLIRLLPQPVLLDDCLPGVAEHPAALELLESSLAIDPTERLTADMMRQHRFLEGCELPARASALDLEFVPVAHHDA